MIFSYLSNPPKYFFSTNSSNVSSHASLNNLSIVHPVKNYFKYSFRNSLKKFRFFSKASSNNLCKDIPGYRPGILPEYCRCIPRVYLLSITPGIGIPRGSKTNLHGNLSQYSYFIMFGISSKTFLKCIFKFV